MAVVHPVVAHRNRTDMVFVRGVLLAILAILRDLILAVGDLEHLVNLRTTLLASVLIKWHDDYLINGR